MTLSDLLHALGRCWRVVATGVLLGLPLVGCGGANETTTVRGMISAGGAPVTHGLINFVAPEGRPLGGGVSPDGRYEFQLPPGEYKVRIDVPPAIPDGWKEGDPAPKLGPRPVPEKYASFATSGLSATVKDQSEPQTIDFALP